ncbi:Protein nud1 [Exophiala xenobiotica]|nr:Protein nud1 [Exophiala xenobiotica]KAK5217387.1 Protein nud1 [Exophiala xenobiotica]KAK5287828.1 Protein nud1 [Exophiala xenobiotica]KAK5315688.1 Protein nud1 [Exophiala xenobiotica]KAK5475998.1 Protein nud1 [Exophiala xenobiotica]
MEPWLDSLSEDWKSEQQSSSPAPSLSSSLQDGSVVLSRSQSRIPHLAKNMRKESTTGSFLRHRSQRSQTRANGESILRERSASNLNLPPAIGSNKYTSLPRRPSSAFSESQNSVQHHTLNEKPASAETPDWKSRLANGEDVANGGFDLFSPSKLEGIFKQPTSSQLLSDNDAVQNDDDTKPRRPFNLPTSNIFSEQYSSVRGTRSRLNLAVLEEINEEEESEQHNQAGVSPDDGRAGSSRGTVRQRVQFHEQALENGPEPSSPRDESMSHHSYNARDLRWRTISGQEELRNEFISPVTMSKQNSIRATVLQHSVDVDIQALDTKLMEAAGDLERPMSSASDRDVSYGGSNATRRAPIDEPLPDLTSQSLPDDLSMGTQDFVAHGGFINSRRGGRSNDNSFLRKSLSLSHEPSKIEAHSRDSLAFHSSPPQHSRLWDDSVDNSKISASAPATPPDTSVVHYPENHIRPASSGSPLKLFGNRDTYTNNKLMRILSHFEPDESHESSENDISPGEQQDNVFRMSQFGQGELDGFGFEQAVRRPSPIAMASVGSDNKIFKPTATIDTQDRQIDQVQDHPMNANDAQERDRMTKRRKTLLKDQVTINDLEMEVKITTLEENATLAGKKRTDARPGSDPTEADPEVLASRNLLKPKSTRKSSTSRMPTTSRSENDEEEGVFEQLNHDLTEALAAELATFTHEAVKVNEDSRKASLATKDYMEEANKVMQFIRARGKPMPTLKDISEPGNVSELNPDAILDLEIDAESTKDDFSRPPSRERSSKPSPARRHARHDSRTASYLKKYQDQDDLDVLASTSIMGTWAPVNNNLAAEDAKIPVPDEVQESDPPNIRILNHSETLRKRKYSTSTIEGPQSAQNSMQNSFPTNSSTGSGQKGIINCGTVSIPDKIGVMTFDHEKKVWVRKIQESQSPKPLSHEGETEDDPFESIPDLSIDEQQEMKARYKQMQSASTQRESATMPVEKASKRTELPARRPLGELDPEDVRKRDHILVETQGKNDDEIKHCSLRSKASEHEAKLQSGMPSKPPAQLKEDRKQARVVTIAFSSPVVSGVNYANMSDEDFDALPREEDLPLDESYIDLDDLSFDGNALDSLKKRREAVTVDRPHALTFQPRNISPIQEQDEDQIVGQMSVVRPNRSNELTPAPPRTLTKLQKDGHKVASILCLTPLSDFSVHQIDKARDPEQSYVEDRKHPNALRQAHGSLALAVDQLVKAITDAVQEELFWEELRRLTLGAGKVSSIHALKEYCPVLEELSVSGNNLRQLEGLPSTLRVLDIHDNMLNDMTSWNHLQNLQYLDVSGNELESLECFSSLVHLRSLKANNNRITNVDGILDLDGLLDLQLSGNELVTVDFESAELSRLRSLDLSNNQLSEVKNLASLPALEELDVSRNALEQYQLEADLALTELRLAHNGLAVIGLKHMPMLKYLDLDNNRIKDVQGLSSAYNLEFLSLREQSEPSQIVDLVLSTSNECRTIRLSSNPVANGTLKLPGLPQNNLRELEIAACGVAELPEGFGASFPNCRNLNINFNAVKDIAPLRRMGHLKHLLLAKNRVKKLRRTCLVLSRLGSLEQVDLRDNPLTVGFYSPMAVNTDGKQTLPEARYRLPGGLPDEDAGWLKLMDQVTGLKRRTIELLLADHCKKLVQLDGLAFSHERPNRKDETWTRLTDQKVLMRSAVLPPTHAAEKPAHETTCSLNDVMKEQGTSLIMDCDVFDG